MATICNLNEHRVLATVPTLKSDNSFTPKAQAQSTGVGKYLKPQFKAALKRVADKVSEKSGARQQAIFAFSFPGPRRRCRAKKDNCKKAVQRFQRLVATFSFEFICIYKLHNRLNRKCELCNSYRVVRIEFEAACCDSKPSTICKALHS